MKPETPSFDGLVIEDLKNKYIHFGYYFWGLLLITMVVFSLLAGKVIVLLENDIRFATFVYKDKNPIWFVVVNAVYGLLGLVLSYRSLLFIGWNRAFLKEREGFDRRIVGLEKEDEKADYLRAFMVLLSTIFIFAFNYYVYFVL